MKIVKSPYLYPVTYQPQLDKKVNRYACKKKCQTSLQSNYLACTKDFHGSKIILITKLAVSLFFSFGTAYLFSEKIRTWYEILKYGGEIVGIFKAIYPTPYALTHLNAPLNYKSYKYSKKTLIDCVSKISRFVEINSNEANKLLRHIQRLSSNEVKLISKLFSDFDNARYSARNLQIQGTPGSGFIRYDLKDFKYYVNDHNSPIGADIPITNTLTINPAAATDKMNIISIACHRYGKRGLILGENKNGKKISLTPKELHILFCGFYGHKHANPFDRTLWVEKQQAKSPYKYIAIVNM